ncbi:MAG: hypothetical protein FWC73_04195 [Defluviitaleaceae bacterium]|nr:hypothetical protein [Defluviitaleaceae bacterium]
MIKIVLLDSNREFMDKFIKYSLNAGGLTVIGAASDGDTALELIKSNQVDIVLINLPGDEGLYVLDQMAFAPGNKPVFIALTNEAGKVDYILPKTAEMFYLGEQITKIWESKIRKSPSRGRRETGEWAEEIGPLPPRPTKRSPKPFIEELLHKIGAPYHLQGSAYLKTAFQMIVAEGHYQSRDLMNRIYPEVAKIHKTTPVQVERSIRYMATRTMTKGRDLIITNYLGIPMVPPGKRITNSELLSALVYCYFKEHKIEE